MMRPPVVILGGAVTVEDAAPCVRLVVSHPDWHQSWDMTPAEAMEIAARLLGSAARCSSDPIHETQTALCLPDEARARRNGARGADPL